MKKLTIISLALIGFLHPAIAQNFKIKSKGVFTPQHKTVLLLNDSIKNSNLILFRTKLQVNTDGTPVSYHPFDLTGGEKAINTIGNAIAVYKKGTSKNLCLDKKTYSEAINVFKRFRDSDYDTVPAGYKIIWKNVLIPEKVGGTEKPCIIKTGEYKGYYGSATSLKNDLTHDKGECECDNQVNPLKIPALVLAGGNNNIVRKYGADKGDLLIAYNSVTKKLVYAVINDFGPKTNLGEGSVLLNMKLLVSSAFPKTRKETYKLATSNEIFIAIIPASRSFKPQKPFSIENINSRVSDWLNETGIHNEAELIALLDRFKGEL